LLISPLAVCIIALHGWLCLSGNFSNVLWGYLARKSSHNLGTAPNLLYYMIQKRLRCNLSDLIKIPDHFALHL
jgi:hypothetical protein